MSYSKENIKSLIKKVTSPGLSYRLLDINNPTVLSWKECLVNGKRIFTLLRTKDISEDAVGVIYIPAWSDEEMEQLL